MDTLQGLLFDADGTLLDTYDIILTSMRYAVNEVGGNAYDDEQLMARVGTPLLDQMRFFANGNERRAEELVRIYRQHNDGIHDEAIRPFPDTKEALALLAEAGFPLGVVTSKRHLLAARGLEMSGLLPFFSVVIGSDDWPEHKPMPGPILHGCRCLDIDPRHCAYIGDSPFDIQAANAAGCMSVAALWGMFGPEELLACHPSWTCDSLMEAAGRFISLKGAAS